MQIIEITAGVRNVIKDLENGARLEVTHEGGGFSVAIIGGGKHRGDVLIAAFNALKEANMLREDDKGLFEGCGQSFIVVR